MRKYTRKLLSVLLALLLVLTLLPVSASAATHTGWNGNWSGVVTGDTIVLGSTFTGEIVIPATITELTIDGSVCGALTGVYIRQANTSVPITLTIKDLNFTAPDDTNGIALVGSTLNVQGNCSITGGRTITSFTGSAISCTSLTLNIKSGATLTATGGAETGFLLAGFGIYDRGSLTINIESDATLNAIGGAASGSSSNSAGAGICADTRDLTVTVESGGTLNATGGSTTGDGDAGCGMFISNVGTITIKNGGSISATGGDCAAGGTAGYGIWTYQDLILDFVSGGSLTAVGGTENGVPSGWGVYAENDLTITGTPDSINGTFGVYGDYINSTGDPTWDNLVPLYVCEIVGGSMYSTLDEALANAQDMDMIVLFDDIIYPSTIRLDKMIVINLNGHKLTVNGAGGTAVELEDGAFVLGDTVGGGECVLNGNITSTGWVTNSGGDLEASGLIVMGAAVTVNGSITVDIDDANAGTDEITVYGVMAQLAADVTVNGSVTVNVVNAVAGDISVTGVVSAVSSTLTISSSVDVTVDGAADYITVYGAEVDEAELTVYGDITATVEGDGSEADGVGAYEATVDVFGNVTAIATGSDTEACGVGASDATVTVNGSVTAEADTYTCGVGASDATVTVNGSVTAEADTYTRGVSAYNATVKIGGKLTVAGGSGECLGIYADSVSDIVVGAGIEASGSGVVFGARLVDATVVLTVYGDITATATGTEKVTGLSAEYGSTATVHGNVRAEATGSGDAYGVYAGVDSSSGDGADVRIEGTITATKSGGVTGVYITVGSDDKTETIGATTDGDYLKYTDGTNTVWVRDPSTWEAPSFSYEGDEGADVRAGETKPAGYEPFSVEFAVGGTPSPVVRKISGDSRIILNGRNSLLIPAGLPAGTYKVELEAENIEGTAAFTFTFTVTGGGGGVAPPPAPKTESHVKYLDGYPNGTVGADNNITRAEAAAMLFRLIEDETKNAPLAASFTDVHSGEWYYQAVAYLEKHGILDGYPDGTFKPEKEITRAEFAAIVFRFGELATGVPNTFPDVPDSYWAAGYINSAAAKGYIKGYPDGTFKPDNSITRAEAVTILNRMFDRKIELGDIPAGANKFTDINSAHWAYCDIIEASITHEFTRKANGYELWR